MDITITGIGKENLKAFRPLMPGLSLADYKICVGAIADDTACGVCLFDILGDALMLDYIYVVPDYRRCGVASTMLMAVRKLAIDMGSLPIHVNYPESAKDLHRFFLDKGFLIFRDGTAYKVPAESFLDSNSFKKMIKINGGHKVKSLSELSVTAKNKFKKALYAADVDADIVDDASLSPDISYFAFNEKTGEPGACLLCQKKKNTIVILYMFIFEKDATALTDILRRLSVEVQKSGNARKYEILFVTMDKKVEAFAKKLVDDESMLSREGRTISGILA